MTSHIRNRASAGLLACAIGFGLAGCSSDSNATWSQIIVAAKLVWSNNSGITLQQAASVPYASMGIRIGEDQERLIVLASQTQDTQLWTSAARIAIVTENGRIVRSSGFGHGLSATSSEGGDPLTLFEHGDSTTRHTRRFVDFQDLNRFSVPVDCTIKSGGTENIVILEKNIRAHRVDEHCNSEVLEWSFDNIFWLGDSPGLVWRSIQNLHPELGPVETEIFRPPAGP